MTDSNDLRNRIIGLGEHSFKKSYFPELQKKINELNLFKSVVDQVNDFILIMQPADGLIKFINHSAKTFFKITEINQNYYLSDLVDEEYWESVKSILSDEEKLNELHDFKYKIGVDDSDKYLGNSVSMVKSNNENVCVLIARDITDRILMEESLIKAKERAEEGTRLKSAFLANMSHEIRTPMNGIVGFVDLLKEVNNDNDTRNKYIDIIKASCDDLLRIIDDILDISKIESGLVSIHKFEFNINSMLRNLHEIYLLKAEALVKDIKIKFEYGLSDDESTLIIDGVRLKQVLRNLIDNAIKFTHEGEVKVVYEKVNNKIEFKVSDTGIGIRRENLKVIFERFRQSEDYTTRMFGGTGLGLSICQGLLNLMGGSIKVESEFGIGSVFTVSLPVS